MGNDTRNTVKHAADAHQHPRTRANLLEGMTPEGMLTEKPAGKDGTRRWSWVPGRDASFAAMCLRVTRGKADAADMQLFEAMQQHDAFETKVKNSKYLSGKFAEAQASLKG